MLRCNLSILLAERGLKITQVSKDTGISRTTLTALYHNISHGIQFDTVNTLCTYLKVTPGELIAFIPIDIKITCVSSNDPINIEIEIIENGKHNTCNFMADCDTQINEFGEITSLDIFFGLYIDDEDEELKIENQNITRTINSLPRPFASDFENKLINEIIDHLFSVTDNCEICTAWDNVFKI